jgi:hypothetical protein
MPKLNAGELRRLDAVSCDASPRMIVKGVFVARIRSGEPDKE